MRGRKGEREKGRGGEKKTNGKRKKFLNFEP
jgi:hypothetical protein